MREAIQPRDVSRPGNPYSHAIRCGELVFISGQVAKDPGTGRIVGETIEEQARVALENLRRVAAAAGATLERVVKVTVFLKNAEDFDGFNKIYAEVFTPPYPARSTLVAPTVNAKLLVEVEAVAAVEKGAAPCLSD